MQNTSTPGKKTTKKFIHSFKSNQNSFCRTNIDALLQLNSLNDTLPTNKRVSSLIRLTSERQIRNIIRMIDSKPANTRSLVPAQPRERDMHARSRTRGGGKPGVEVDEYGAFERAVLVDCVPGYVGFGGEFEFDDLSGLG